MWTFERDERVLDVLCKRHELLRNHAGFHLPEMTPVGGDANVTLPAVLDSLAEEREADRKAGSLGSLTLAFVDNVGLNVKMSTLGQIQATIRADLVVHLPVRAVWRSITQYRSKRGTPRKLDNFFGSRDAWEDIKDQAEIPSAYQACVQEQTTEELQDFSPVYIRSDRQEFALCIYARKTSGIGKDQRGWVDIIGKLGETCNGLPADLLESVLNVASDRQSTLWDSFGLS